MTEGPRFSRKSDRDPLIGRTLSGRYVIHALVGQGGMGKVFEAQQVPLGRSVALKVLDARHVDRDFARRFFQEAAILARLKSRHTVTIYDYGRDGDFFFIAMELVAGPSLDHLIASEGPLEVGRAVAIAEQVCRSLREAHGQGIIHRDLKPANVMLTVTEDGEELAKVLDFGLAKRTDQASQDETQAYIVPGSPKYMAPEAIHQRPIDGRLDMYALGVMLYYMLVGAVPFDRADPMDILRAHLHEQPRPLRAMNPNVQVPAELEMIVMRCLAKAPEERFADMQQLLETLRAFSRTLARPSSPRLAPALSTFPPPGTGGYAPVPRGGVSGNPPAFRGRVSTPAPAPSSATTGNLPPVQSGAPLSQRSSSAPLHLGLDQRDMRTAPGTVAAPDSRRARQVLVAAALGAGAILGLAAWQAARSDAANHTESLTVQPLPPPVTPVAATTAPPTMVISPDEVVAKPASIALHVTCDPPGSGVYVNGKRIGFAPGDFEWVRDESNPKRPLLVQLRHPGYAPHTTRYPLDTPRIDLDVTLLPKPKPVAAAPAEGDTSAESGEATTEDESESGADEETESADPPAPDDSL
jgi:serine/threonine-protein kinase